LTAFLNSLTPRLKGKYVLRLRHTGIFDQSGGKDSYDLQFDTIEEAHQAFTSGTLTEMMTFKGENVRLRPRIGAKTARIQKWLEIFYYLDREFTTRFWMQMTFCVLLAVHMIDRLALFIIQSGNNVFFAFGSFGKASKFIAHTVLLMLAFIFFGFHSYMDVRDATASLSKEGKRRRMNMKMGRTASFLGSPPTSPGRRGWKPDTLCICDSWVMKQKLEH